MLTTISGTDPFSGKQLQFKSYRAVALKCYEIIKNCVAENERRGKTGDDRFIVCALSNKRTGVHVWLNLTCHEPEMGITCSSPKAMYGGYMGHAEMLLSGTFRVATAEEEAQCRQKDIDDKATVLRKREENAARAA